MNGSIVGGGSEVVRTAAWVAQDAPCPAILFSSQSQLQLGPAEVPELVHEAISIPVTANQLQQVIDKLKGLRADLESQQAEQAIKHSSYAACCGSLPRTRSSGTA